MYRARRWCVGRLRSRAQLRSHIAFGIGSGVRQRLLCCLYLSKRHAVLRGTAATELLPALECLHLNRCLRDIVSRRIQPCAERSFIAQVRERRMSESLSEGGLLQPRRRCVLQRSTTTVDERLMQLRLFKRIPKRCVGVRLLCVLGALLEQGVS